MCLIVFGWDVHPKYKLILAANRDEYYHRSSAIAGFWEDHPDIVGGRDLQAGGSWMTVSRKGHFAAVTNFRDPDNVLSGVASRGELPLGYMFSQDYPSVYCQKLHEEATLYNGFNILMANHHEMTHYSNYERKVNVLNPGVYGLSNALLDTHWPKVDLAKRKFQALIDTPFTHAELVEMMNDTSIADDVLIPETGLSREMEKALSPMCIRMENYGTCCSSVMTMDRNGHVNFTEKSYPFGGREEKTVNFQFDTE